MCITVKGGGGEYESKSQPLASELEKGRGGCRRDLVALAQAEIYVGGDLLYRVNFMKYFEVAGRERGAGTMEIGRAHV